MPSEPFASSPSSRRQITSLSVLIGRILWSLLGPILLVAMALVIISRGGGWATGLDLSYAIVVLLMVWGRVVEHRSGQATSMNGEAATSHDLRLYLLIMVPAAALVWAAANVLGNHILR